MFQIKGDPSNLTTKCNMLSWFGSWIGDQGEGAVAVKDVFETIGKFSL